MKKLVLLVIFLVGCAVPAWAQDEYNRVEVFAGYSHNRVDLGPNDGDAQLDDVFDEREGYNGVNAAITGNVSRYVGITGDYSFHRRNLDSGTFNTGADARIHNFLGGVQIQDNARAGSRARPFARFLAGAARYSIDLSNFDNNFEDFSETGFAAALGGGLDVRVHERVDIRAFQFEYNPVRLNGETLNNFRIGVGVVFR